MNQLLIKREIQRFAIMRDLRRSPSTNTIVAMKLLFFFAAILTLFPQANAALEENNATDPVVVQGKGFEIRRSELDQVLATAKAQHPEDDLPPDADVHAVAHLIEIHIVLNKATDAEKAAGKKMPMKDLPPLCNRSAR